MAMFGFGASCEQPKDLPKPAADLPATQPSTQPAAKLRTAVFAGGCFWCTEGVFEQLKGVTDVVSGYAGDSKETADYETVSSGSTKHAEAIQITYDPSQVSYGELLRVFFATHDPTTKDRQGPDEGHQYRSAVFYANEDEKRVAQAYIKQLEESKAFKDPIVTTLEPLVAFYPAEQYHQDFVRLHPNHPYILQQAMPKVKKLRDHFSDQVKPAEK